MAQLVSPTATATQPPLRPVTPWMARASARQAGKESRAEMTSTSAS